MPQEMSVAELRRIAALHKGLTPESWLMDWAAGKIEALESALYGLLKFHQEGDGGAELPREYWSPEYLAAVEYAESLMVSNVEVTGAARPYRAASVWTAGLGNDTRK